MLNIITDNRLVSRLHLFYHQNQRKKSIWCSVPYKILIDKDHRACHYIHHSLSSNRCETDTTTTTFVDTAAFYTPNFFFFVLKISGFPSTATQFADIWPESCSLIFCKCNKKQRFENQSSFTVSAMAFFCGL